MKRHEVLGVLGRPKRTEARRDLRKSVQSSFYGLGDRYAIVLVDGRVFTVASTRIE
jgi:hypothetical protein